MDNINTWTELPVEESVRMTEDRDKWRMVWPTLGLCTTEEQRTKSAPLLTPALLSAHTFVFFAEPVSS